MKHNSILKFLATLGVLFTFVSMPAVAQNDSLHITTTSPRHLAFLNPLEDTIQISFSVPIDPQEISPGQLAVFGRWSGPMQGELQLNTSGTLLSFIPGGQFSAGELVTCRLKHGIAAVSGDTLSYSYAFQFWIDAGQGNFDYPDPEILAVRLEGEGQVQTYGAYAGDMNNDNASDLVVVNERSDDVRIFLNDGMAGFVHTGTVAMGMDGPSPSEGADFNADGEIDVAVSTAHGNELRILIGNGNGDLILGEILTTGNGARGLAVLDLNGDMLPDLATANRQSSDVTLLLNTGYPNFSSTTIDPPGEGESGLAATDMNNDGIEDLVLGMFTSKEVVILLGSKDGTFEQSASMQVAGNPWMLTTGDFDRDGNPDIASVNSQGHTMTVLFGDGIGGIHEGETYLHPSMSFPIAIDAGDLDGDRDIDLVVSNYTSANFLVFENDGLGSFSMVKELAATESGSCTILHDRDSDGDLDITGVDEITDELLLFENTGTSGSAYPGEADMLPARIIPNPGKDQYLQITLEAPASLECLFIAPDGKLIGTSVYKSLQAGEHTLTMPLYLPSGLFILELRVGEHFKTLSGIRLAGD